MTDTPRMPDRTGIGAPQMADPKDPMTEPKGGPPKVPDIIPSRFKRLRHEDIARIQAMFKPPYRHLISTTVPRSIYITAVRYPEGTGALFEKLIMEFNGEFEPLMRAAACLSLNRRENAKKDPPTTLSGRIGAPAGFKLEEMMEVLSPIRGISRSKVLAGLIQQWVWSSE